MAESYKFLVRKRLPAVLYFKAKDLDIDDRSYSTYVTRSVEGFSWMFSVSIFVLGIGGSHFCVHGFVAQNFNILLSEDNRENLLWQFFRKS